MNKKYIIKISLILLLITLFSGCQNSYYDVLLDGLQNLFSGESKKLDIAASLNFKFNKQEELSNPIANSWFNLMPETSSVDLAISVSYNPSEVRIRGHVSCLGELVQVFKDLGVGIDIDFDLYLNKDEGIFLRSVDGFAVTKNFQSQWKPQITKDNWLRIGSTEEAKAIINSLYSLQNAEILRPLLESNIEEIESKKDKDIYTIETNIDIYKIWTTIFKEDQLKDSNLYRITTDFLDSTAWQASYKLNSKKELTESVFRPSLNTDSPQTNITTKLVSKIDGVFYRFAYNTPKDKSLKPVGDYK